MIAVRTYLQDRRDELHDHAKLIHKLEEASVGGGQVRFPIDVQQKHLSILRSGLVLHLYNVVEAVMTRVLEELATEVAKHHPSTYADNILKEWVKSSTRPTDGAGPDRLLQRIEEIAHQLIQRSNASPLEIRRGSGNWDDKSILRVSSNLGVELDLDEGLRRRAYGNYVDDISRLGFIRKRRNDLAHGVLTFVEGARDRTCEDLQDLVEVVSDYLERVVACFEAFLEACRFLATSQV